MWYFDTTESKIMRDVGYSDYVIRTSGIVIGGLAWGRYVDKAILNIQTLELSPHYIDDPNKKPTPEYSCQVVSKDQQIKFLEETWNRPGRLVIPNG